MCSWARVHSHRASTYGTIGRIPARWPIVVCLPRIRGQVPNAVTGIKALMARNGARSTLTRQITTTSHTFILSTKWTPFCKRHFQMNFFAWKFAIRISFKSVPMGPINDKPVLVRIMASSEKSMPLRQLSGNQMTINPRIHQFHIVQCTVL